MVIKHNTLYIYGVYPKRVLGYSVLYYVERLPPFWDGNNIIMRYFDCISYILQSCMYIIQTKHLEIVQCAQYCYRYFEICTLYLIRLPTLRKCTTNSCVQSKTVPRDGQPVDCALPVMENGPQKFRTPYPHSCGLCLSKKRYLYRSLVHILYVLQN